MKESDHRDRVKYAKLETGQLEDVKGFLDQKHHELETAELTVRRSAGVYVVEIRPTDEPVPTT